MNLKDFRQLKKLLTLAAANDQDHEALASFRAATKIIASSGFTWEMVMDRVVSVVQEVEPAPGGGDDDLEAAFDLALRNAGVERVAERHPGGRVR